MGDIHTFLLILFYDYLPYFLKCALVVFIFQSIMFFIATIRKNNGLADVGWGIGFILISITITFLHLTANELPGLVPVLDSPDNYTFDDTSLLLITLLTFIWGLRLTVYLFIRNWKNAEDWRYAKWRQDWGKMFLVRSYFQVFILQGVFMLIIALPIILTGVSFIRPREALSFLSCALMFAGSIVWLMGFFFQATGDYQLYIFKKDPANKGKIMRYGLWQYTRHPNYFGEASMWWGIFLISSASASGITGVLLRMIGPATITFMLLRVSGVTMLEGKYQGNKEYEDYQRNTSSFIPLPRREA